jgi:hypothetical protein
MHVPNVKNVNLGKRHKKKHYFKVGDPIVFKWWGERDYGFVSQLTKNKEGYATYKVKSTGRLGCIYSDLELDDVDDPYCYVSSILTKSITDVELKKIDDHKNKKHLTVVKPTATTVTIKKTPPKNVVKKVVRKKQSVNKSELKRAINKQKKFLRGEVNKSFW